MSTNKPRIQAYVQSDLYQQFDQERSQWGLNQSQALERILSERYRTDNKLEGNYESDNKQAASDLMPLISSINELRLQVSTLEDELESKLLSKLQNHFLIELRKLELKSSSSSESPKRFSKEPLKDRWERELEEKYRWEDGCLRVRKTDGNILLFDGPLGDVSKKYNTCKLFDSLTDSQFTVDIDRLIMPGELESELEPVASELLGKPISELLKGISQRALSIRLGCSHPHVFRLRKAGKIGEYTKQHDPDGLEWEFREGKYYPAVEVSSDRAIAVE